MGRDCPPKRVPIALVEADQRTSGRRHQRRLTSPPLPSRGARRQGLNGPAHPIRRLVSRLPPSQAGMRALRARGLQRASRQDRTQGAA